MKPEVRSKVAVFVQGHVPLLVSVAASLMVALHLLAVARGDMRTALGLLTATGVAEVVSATLTRVLPLAMAATTGAFVAWMVRRSDFSRSDTIVLGLIATAVVLRLVPFGLVVLVAAIFTLGAALKRWDALPDVFDPTHPAWWLAVPVAVLLTTPLTTDTVWLPLEDIELATAKGSAHVSGYVLEDDGSSVTLLVEHDRSLRLVAATAVKARRYCETESSRSGFLDRPLLQIDAEVPDYPPCPD